MKPIDLGIDVPLGWKRVVYAEDQPEYLPLPVIKNEDGYLICKWELTLWERLQVLFNGFIWLDILTFNNPLQPIRPHVDKPEFTISDN